MHNFKYETLLSRKKINQIGSTVFAPSGKQNLSIHTYTLLELENKKKRNSIINLTKLCFNFQVLIYLIQTRGGLRPPQVITSIF